MALLQDNFWPAVLQDDTGCGTTVYAHSVASRSARIASCFLELEKMNQDLECKLRNDFNNILNSMDRLSPSPTSQPVPPLLNPPARTISSIHNSPFTTAAYSWLLENIPNPYPSSTVKTSLAQQHNVSLSAVNSWFVSARRRMGWTALCRDYFNNCRADALDAACRALVNEDPNRPLPPDVIHAFIGVKVAAEGLYSSNLTKSVLAGELDVVVRDMVDQDSILLGRRKHCEVKEVVEFPEASGVGSLNQKLVPQDYYPSPDSSCSFSPAPPPLDESLTDDSEEEVTPPILAGRKRRLSCSEPSYATISAISTKRMKHLSFSSSVEACLSSPSTSSEEFAATHSHNQKPCFGSIPQSSTNASASRKRCLSDADTTGTPKRPRGLTAEPRLHSVSDPLPLPSPESDHTIDEWFECNFDTLFALPPPVDIIEPDISAQWEVELFKDYNIPEGSESQKRPSKSLNPPTGDLGSTSVDLFSLSFLQSLESEGFVAPSDIMNPAIAVSAVDSIPQDLSLSSESIDWTALLDGQISEPSLDSIFVQPHTDLLPLPEVDLSILQLP